MDVDIIEKSKDGLKAIIHVKGTTPHYMNTLRRLLMNEVPVLAVENVEFRNNSSILYDEMVALRLGLLPIKTDLKSFELSDKEEESQVKMTLKASADKEPQMVYAKDIKSKDKKTVPVYEDTPIVKLHPGQKIECEMTAVMGQGNDHSKWSPCLAWYKYYPHVKITKQPKNAKDLAKKYPTIFEMKKDKLTLNQDNLVREDIIDEGIVDESDGAIKYEEKDDFVLFIESWGQLEITELVNKALDIHNEQLKEFGKLVKKL